MKSLALCLAIAAPFEDLRRRVVPGHVVDVEVSGRVEPREPPARLVVRSVKGE